jgi:cellulose synthase operon protein C
VAEAKAIYQRALLRTPDNAVLLNNLALIYAQEGDAQGIAPARKAQALLPVPEITDTLGWVLVRAGQVAEGLNYLRDAQSRAAAEPGISYHIAYALVRMGRDEDALRELTRLFRKDADFPEQEAADKLRREVQARLGRGAGARDAGLDPVVE